MGGLWGKNLHDGHISENHNESILYRIILLFYVYMGEIAMGARPRHQPSTRPKFSPARNFELSLLSWSLHTYVQKAMDHQHRFESAMFIYI